MKVWSVSTLFASFGCIIILLIFEPPHGKINKRHVHPAKTRISLGIRPVWSESSLCAQRVTKDPRFLHADREDADQTAQMPRLVWVFAGRTCHFVGFVMSRLILGYSSYNNFLGYLNSSHFYGNRFHKKNVQTTVNIKKNWTPEKMGPKDADGMTKQCRSWSDCSSVW